MGILKRLREVWWLSIQMLFAWVLILVESCVIMSTDYSSKALELEPLRIITLFISVIIFLTSLLVLGHPLSINTKAKSKRLMNFVIIAHLAVWAVINLEVTLQWKHTQPIADTQLFFSILVQVVKQYTLTQMLFHLVTYRILRLLALSCPVFYYLFRCEFYSTSIIESVILVLFPVLAGLTLLENEASKSRVTLNYSEHQSIQIETQTLKKERISILSEKRSISNEKKSDFEKKPTQARTFKDFPKEMIFDKFPDGMAVINSDGKFEYFNESMSKILNCSKEEVVEKLLSLPNKTALNIKEGRTTKIIKKSETVGLLPTIVSDSAKSFSFIGREIKESTKLRSSNANIKKQLHAETVKQSPVNALELTELQNKGIRSFSKLFFRDRTNNLKEEASSSPRKLLKSSTKVQETKRIARNKKDESMKFDTGNFTQPLIDQENIDQYFENIFNDHFESDHRDVRRTLENVLKLLTDLRDYFSKGNEDEKNGSPRDLKIRMRYSATEISRKDRFFRKFTICPSFAVSVESFIKLERKTRTLEILINPMLVEGDVFILMQLRDISNKTMLKQMKELNRQRNSSLASIIHEFRSPLGGVLSILEVLKPQISQELQQKYLQPAFTSASALLYLVNDILDLHQMNAKELRLVFADCSLSEICENSMNMIRFKADKRGVTLETILSENIPKIINTDPNRLQQILVNLLSNAIKFTDRGKISIEGIYLPDKKIKLQVRDTGIGIERENLKKLFKSFGKIDLGKKNDLNPQGAGLGLFISHGLAKRLNTSKGEGGLAVASQLGEGTCFSFIIDDMALASENVEFLDEVESVKIKKMLSGMNKSHSFTIRKDTQRKPDNEVVINMHPTHLIEIASEKTEKTNTCSCTKVLIVDDDDLNIWALKSQFETFNITNIDIARNGEEAVQKFIEKSSQKMMCCSGCYTLILMDCEMPVKNGLVATKEIRERAKFSCYHNHTIIGVSGYSSAEFLKKCFEAGMDDVITKPITIKNIRHILKTVNIS